MIIMGSFSDSAELTCQWNGNECNQPFITPVTQQNEVITVAGQATNHINYGTSSINLFRGMPNLKYIPTKLFLIFPNLYYFATSSSSSRLTLVTNAIINCNSMTVLAFQEANVVNIPEGFAQTCVNLIAVQFINAGVETIDKNAFKGLIKLVEFNMRNNKISCLPPDLFQTIPSIQSILLEDNKIKAIDSRLFRNLPKLQEIRFKNNLLSYLPLMDFTGSAQKEWFVLDVSRNPINAIKPDICDFLESQPSNLKPSYYFNEINCFLQNNAQTELVDRSNCRTTMANSLKICYSSWTSSMNAPVNCGEVCPWNSIWQQILDYLKRQK